MKSTLALLGAVALSAVPFSAGAIEWGSVPGKDIVLFTPGQASFEWTLTQSDHSAAKSMRTGKSCRECHTGEEKDIGKLVGSGKKVEPQPLKGNPGYLALNAKAAHDGERLYLRLEWTGTGMPATGMDKDHETKVAAMFSDGTIAASKLFGCWVTCHDDSTNMANAPAGKKITKYLFASRSKVTATGGGENYKSPDEIAGLLEQGQFLELWRAKLNPGQPPEPADGYVLDKRHESDKPAIDVDAQFADGKWVVVFSRPLAAPGKTHISFAPGKTYIVNFSVHDAQTEGRFHYVSLEQTLALDGGKADLVANKQ